MEKKLIQYGREVIGQYLAGVRTEKGISKYQVMQHGLRIETINTIELGSSSYTIDSLLKYTTGIGVYMFFGNKEGKDAKPIDLPHMLGEALKNDPKI